MPDHTDDPVIRQLSAWGQAHEAVRALLLTSTRARPHALLDPFSDYDVIVAVRDVQPFFADRRWLATFGEVLALYRDPIKRIAGYERFAYITQYAHDHLKIDFTILQADLLRHAGDAPELRDELDAGYRVLLDKDHLTDALPPPTYGAYLPTPPTQAEYLELVEVFLHEATYVAKNLWRDELLPAKYSFDHVMKGKLLRQMLEWRVGTAHDWQVRPGVLGKGLKERTPPDVWGALEGTYVGADEGENWQALFDLMALFMRVGTDVGAALDYAYPHEQHARMVAYLRDVQQLGRQRGDWGVTR